MAIIDDITKRADPRNFGVTFDGSTDDTAAWQLWLTYVRSVAPITNNGTTGLAVNLPEGDSLNGQKLELPHHITITADGQGTTLTATTDDDAFLYLTGRHQHLRGIHFKAVNGARCIELQRFARSSMRDIVFTQTDPDRQAMFHRLSTGWNGAFSNIFAGLVFHSAASQTVASWEHLPDSTGFNANLVQHVTCFVGPDLAGVGTPTAPAILIGSQANYCHNNHFDTIVGEHSPAGLLHFAGSQANVITNPSIHDNTGLTQTDHSIKFGPPVTAANPPRGNVVTGYDRRDGSLASGIADVWFDSTSDNNAVHTIGSRLQRTMVVELNGTPVTVTGIDPALTELRNPANLLGDYIYDTGDSTLKKLTVVNGTITAVAA